MLLESVNFHLWKPCNYRCKFCFATFEDVPGRLTKDAALQIVDAFAPHCDKVTFVGGEPTLCPFLGELIEHAHALGLTTSIVSNGERLRRIIERHATSLDWVGLSVDSIDEATSARLGRGDGGHVARSIALATLAHERGILVKLNTVVTAWNQHEDLSPLVRAMRPQRWKVFRVLPVEGQNDGSVEPLLISTSAFNAYVERHAHLAAEGYPPIAEDNADMMGSYVMIDPMGRFFDNVEGRLVYSPAILEVGVEAAFARVRWERDRLVARGGLYQWRRRPTR
ncbi:MAG: radical SAM protein [Myxococcales bacterium]|nr:radical SAM protein [Myxococcales bacterium]